jgi:hypothetical protein
MYAPAAWAARMCTVNTRESRTWLAIATGQNGEANASGALLGGNFWKALVLVVFAAVLNNDLVVTATDV